MRKIALFLAIIICFSAITAYADGDVITYNTNLSIAEDGTVTAGGSDTVTVDLTKYELVGEGTLFEQSNLILTRPGFAIGYFACKNNDQTPGEHIPISVSVNYEVALAQQRYEADGVTKIDEQLATDVPRNWLDSCMPQFTPESGDFEWAYLAVTQDMIDAAGGKFEVVFFARAIMYPDAPLKDLGQVFSDDFVRVYQKIIPVIGEQDVVINYNPTVTDTTVYQVDVSWGSMDFVYSEGEKGTWNPDSCKYEGGTESVWVCEEGANAISVSNRSNAEVKVGLAYIQNRAYSDISAAFTLADGTAVSVITLPTADNKLGENGAGKATELTAYLQIINGKLTDGDTNVRIGTIAVILN